MKIRFPVRFSENGYWCAFGRNDLTQSLMVLEADKMAYRPKYKDSINKLVYNTVWVEVDVPIHPETLEGKIIDGKAPGIDVEPACGESKDDTEKTDPTE